MLVPSRDRCHYPRNFKAQSHVLLLFFFLVLLPSFKKKKVFVFRFGWRTGFSGPFLFHFVFTQRKRKLFLFSFLVLITCASVLVWACLVLLQIYMDTPRPGSSPALSTCPSFFENFFFLFFSFWLILLSFWFSSLVYFTWHEHCTSKGLSPPLSAAFASRKRLRQDRDARRPLEAEAILGRASPPAHQRGQPCPGSCIVSQYTWTRPVRSRFLSRPWPREPKMSWWRN